MRKKRPSMSSLPAASRHIVHAPCPSFPYEIVEGAKNRSYLWQTVISLKNDCVSDVTRRSKAVRTQLVNGISLFANLS